MAIVAFWSSGKEETAKTLSMVAISTYMAMKNNYRILTVSTRYSDDTLESCFWQKPTITTELDRKRSKFDIASGIEGLAKALKSNRITPEIITNYTKVVYKDRLEVLLPPQAENYEEYEKIFPIYQDLLIAANKYYDIIFVDLNKGLNKQPIIDVLKIADVIVINMTQRMRTINEIIELREQNPLFQKNNSILLVGKYDKYSKFSAKNIARYMGTREEIYTMPYSTNFFDATNEGEVDEFFWKYRNVSESDRNAIFLKEVDKNIQAILMKLQEVQMRK